MESMANRRTVRSTSPRAREFRTPHAQGGSAAEKVADLAERVEALPDRVLLYADDGDAAVATVLQRGLRPDALLVRRSTLEDVFLKLTGRTLVD